MQKTDQDPLVIEKIIYSGFCHKIYVLLHIFMKNMKINAKFVVLQLVQSEWVYIHSFWWNSTMNDLWA